MNVQIQSVKFDADKRLVEFVENKMDKLDRFAERSTGAEVILRLDKDFEKGNKIATVTLHMPGEDLWHATSPDRSRNRWTRRSTPSSASWTNSKANWKSNPPTNR